MIRLKPGEKIDDLMRNGLRIIQAQNLPKFGLEGALLANYPDVIEGWQVCDLCTGSGVVPLLLTTRAINLHITGVEVSPELSDLARRSVQMNGLEGTIEILTQDLLNLDLPGGRWDLITANPPYFTAAGGLVSPDTLRAQARSQVRVGVADVIRTAHRLLRTKGYLALSYRVGGLPEVMESLSKQNMGLDRLRFVHHNLSSKASSFLLMARKGVGAKMRVEPPLVIFQADGGLTPEMKGLYFKGKALESRSD